MSRDHMQTKSGDHDHPRSSWRRAGVTLGALALAGAVGASVSSPAQGNLFEPWSRLQDRQEIEDLEYCYGAATDAIGRGDVEAGRAIYQTCFTQNAVISASFPGADPSGPPDLSTVGPSSWADIVESVFDSSGYQSTQHLISNVRINFTGFNTATMTSYLNATHVLDPTSSIDLANGTYTSVVVRTAYGWRIAERDLDLITFMRVQSPPAAP